MVHSERNGVDYAYSREALEDSDLLSFGRQISLGMVSIDMNNLSVPVELLLSMVYGNCR